MLVMIGCLGKELEYNATNNRGLYQITMTKQIVLQRPDDFHIHLRDEDLLSLTVPHVTAQCARAIVMPNLKPPITTVKMAADYRQRILAHIPEGQDFEPLMTLYLTDSTDSNDLQSAKDSGIIHAVKCYPAGATTHSEAGVTNLEALYPLFETMQQIDMPLLLHGEVTDTNVDIFDREAVFIERTLNPIIKAFPELRIVLEHITTKVAVDFINESSTPIAATITAHHLWLTRNDLLVGGIRPHYYCLPIVKRTEDRAALREAATSGNPKFFMGTDSAPHPIETKESSCGCAGIYTAHATMSLYATVFEQENALEKLSDFCCKFGAEFYQLPINSAQCVLEKKSWTVPESYAFSHSEIIPFASNERLKWTIINKQEPLR